ncbi:MAG: hypothetical protein AAF646_03680 [Pseudomonadota bacterium]
MALPKYLIERARNVGLVIAIAFACGYILQESELLGPSPLIPGNVPLEAVANGDADAEFTSGTRGASSATTTIIFPR